MEKKKYQKPSIIIEDFSLSDNIAGNCDVKTDTQNAANECGKFFLGVGDVFGDGMQGCTDFGVNVNDDEPDYNGICYHVPTDNNLFTS